MSRPLQVALVGYGYAAQTIHEPLIQHCPDLVLSHVVSRRADELAKTHPTIQFVPTLQQVLTDDQVEIVVVTTPNALHAEQVHAVLMAGKHVVVEKPFTLDLPSAAALVTLAEERQRALFVFHNRRWDGDFMTVRRLVADNALGRLHHYDSYFDRYRPVIRQRWRESAQQGAGLAYDLAPHLIDQALQLFGMPEAIYAEINIEREHGVTDDAFELMLRYPSLTVRLGAGSLFCRARPRFALYGSTAAYLKHGFDPQEQQLKSGIQPSDAGFGVNVEQYGELTLAGEQGMMPVVQQAGNYGLFYRNVVETVRGTHSPTVTMASALAVMSVMDAMRLSAQQHQWVSC